MSAPRRGPGRALLLLALLALLLGTAAMVLRHVGRGPVLGGRHKIDRTPLHWRIVKTPRGTTRVPVTDGGVDLTGAEVSDGVHAVAVRVVLDKGRTPVAGARVVLRDKDFEWSGVSDAEGRVEFKGVQQGALIACAYKEGYVGIPNRFAVPREDDEAVDLLLAAATELDGVVVAAGDWRPVPDAVVAMEAFPLPSGPGWNRYDQHPRQETRTDGQGRFRLAGGSPDHGFELYVSADGFVPRRVRRPPRGDVAAPEPARVVLQRAARIVGTVLDQDGSPAAGVVVTAEEAQDDSLTGDCRTTGADGSFVMEGLPTGGVVRVRARRQGHVSFAEEEVYLAEGAEEARVDLRLAATGELIVTWERAGGTAPAWVQASLEPEVGGTTFTFQLGRGRDRLLGLRPGRYRLGLYGGVNGWGEASVEVAAGPPTGVHVRLEDDIYLHGRVVNSQGQQLGISSWMLKIEEDPAGSGPRPGRFPGSSHAPERPGGMYFLFRGLRPGSTWRILAKTNLATSWVVLESGVEAPARNLKLVFDPGGFAWGQVAVPSGGSRPPLVRVLFGRVDADASREGSSTSLFGEGHFRIEGLSPGEWEFRAEAQGMASAPVRATIPTVGGGINVGTLSLVSTGVPAASKPGRLQVEAWSATGIPLAGRDVTATREDGSPPPEPLPRRTLRDGRWRATLAAGQYHIVIHNRDGSSAVEGDIDVVVDVETSLILRASK